MIFIFGLNLVGNKYSSSFFNRENEGGNTYGFYKRYAFLRGGIMINTIILILRIIKIIQLIYVLIKKVSSLLKKKQ